MMNALTPRAPNRPFIWPEFVWALQDFAAHLPDEVYVVGGAVRDAMLHRPIHDVDLITPSGAVALARKIANHFQGNVYVLDADRDVGRALVDTAEGRLTIDVARFRGPTLLDDLRDRDFTLNAMAADLKGDLTVVIDPLGGEADLAAKLLRRCSPRSLEQDPVRAWRAIRQSVQFGLRIEQETLRDVRAAAPFTEAASPERVRDELIRTLALSRPAAALRVLDAVGLLGALLPEFSALRGSSVWEQTLGRIEHLTSLLNTVSYSRTDHTAAAFSTGLFAMQLDRYRAQLVRHLESVWPNDRPHRSLLLLAALLIGAQPVDDGGEWVDSVGARLRLSKGEVARLAALLRGYRLPAFLPDESLRSLHRFWRQTGESGVDVCLVALADDLAQQGLSFDQDGWLRLIERTRLLLEAWFEKSAQLIDPPLLVDGGVLMRELGLKSGPLIGDLLDYLREEQAVGQVLTVEAALSAARAYVAQRSG